MTITCRVYDSTNYTQENIAEMFQSFLTDGYISGLSITAAVPTDMTVTVALGRAHIQGYWYDSSAANVLTIGAADASNPRIDRIVLRLTVGTPRSIIAAVLPGTAAGSPSVPALTQNSTIWEISLAQVLVGAGVTSIATGDITDERSSTTTCGLAAVRKTRMSDILPHATVNINTHKITNLATPTATGDGITKKYVDDGGVYGVTKCEIVQWTHTTIPSGWLECNGQSVVRATYPNLFTAWGTTYGSVDGSHFNLPDLRGRNPLGASSSLGTTGGEKTHPLIEAEMPSHDHTAPLMGTYLENNSSGSDLVGVGTHTTTTASSGSGTAHQNLQPYITMKYIVRGS